MLRGLRIAFWSLLIKFYAVNAAVSCVILFCNTSKPAVITKILKVIRNSKLVLFVVILAEF